MAYRESDRFKNAALLHGRIVVTGVACVSREDGDEEDCWQPSFGQNEKRFAVGNRLSGAEWEWSAAGGAPRNPIGGRLGESETESLDN